MKHFKRTNIYKASNVTLNPDSLESISYRWWIFSKRIGKDFVFNEYRYSPSTGGHQRKVLKQLAALGVTPTIFIEAPGGLQDLSSALKLYIQRIADLQAAIEKPRSQKAKNKQRKASIKKYQKLIKVVSNLIVKDGQ